MPPTPTPSIFQALRLWTSKPIRWFPPLLSFIFIFWLFGPSLFHTGPPPPHRFHNGLPPAIGHPHRPPSRIPPDDTHIWPTRANQVRKAFIHGYEGYRKHAFQADELLPVSGKKVNNFNGWGVTIYDALDTMWIMGLDDYFSEALDLISKADFTIPPNEFVPFFETIIRYLGGLLSAYALSGKPVLLEKADMLGEMLLPAFDTQSGLPMFAVNPQNKYLAHLTGKSEYFTKSERIMQIMYTSNITNGVFPTMWDTLTAQPKNAQFSVGAFADSAHEYLLKQWLLTSRSEDKIRDLYLQATNAIINNLLYLSPDRDFLYVTDTTFTPSHTNSNSNSNTDSPESNPNITQKHTPTHTFEHLSCFLPGLFALGTTTSSALPFTSTEERELHTWAAEGLGYACWLSYADQETGLGPDEMVVTSSSSSGKWVDALAEWRAKDKGKGRPPGLREVPPEGSIGRRGYTNRKQTYLLRPETIESFYILWRTTGDERWRERGWAIFQAIEKHAKTEYGYASVYNVDEDESRLKDEMPSYFLAETLKYLYLLFTDEEIIPLDKWVFNTEAHPLPIFEWTEEEKKVYGIGVS
ncbi:hypothetical protein VNI00_014829 [Paramarasmius palmivorus]|uniref:alpha-1,2-Mannosidase n=1 Tax=Paramarasmius palmivorus TaxID=297713 RepID=A0AAW0BP35_9AGAR